MSFRRLSFHTAIMSFSNVLRMLAQLFVVPILARFLAPEDYGVVALAMPFVLFAMMFADAGIALSLVRGAPFGHSAWSTCFWLSSLLGLALSAVIAGLGPLAAWLFEEPRLGPIVMVLACVIFLQAITTVPGATLHKQEKFVHIAGIEIASMLISIALTLWAAINQWGAWALVMQQLSQYSVRLVLTLVFSRYMPRRIWQLGEALEHLRFGRDVLGVRLMDFVTHSADNWIVGYARGAAATGIYTMALMFCRLPGRLISGPLDYVTFPLLSAYKQNLTFLRDIYIFLTRGLAIIVFPAMGLVAAAHEPFFRILLSEKWAESGYLFMLIAPAMALQAVVGLSGSLLFALGRTDLNLRRALEMCILRTGALLVSVWFGLEWVAIAITLSILCYFPRYMYLVLPTIECSYTRLLRTFAWPLLSTTAAVLLYWQLDRQLSYSDWGHLAVAGGLMVAAMGVSMLIQLRTLQHEAQLLHQPAAPPSGDPMTPAP